MRIIHNIDRLGVPKPETALLPAPFLMHHSAWPRRPDAPGGSAHFDGHWRERPALALLAWDTCSRSINQITHYPPRVFLICRNADRKSKKRTPSATRMWVKVKNRKHPAISRVMGAFA